MYRGLTKHDGNATMICVWFTITFGGSIFVWEYHEGIHQKRRVMVFMDGDGIACFCCLFGGSTGETQIPCLSINDIIHLF